MPEGFKLLDAYVEVKADATGIGEKVSRQFTGEIAPAAKKMADAVDTASQRVIAASKRQADAAGALRVAQARLADTEKTSAEGSTQLVAAQEALAKAQRNVASAAEGADRAQRSLGSAQSRLKESGTSAGSSYLSGLRGSLGSGVVGGLIGGVTSGVTSGIVHLVGTAVSDIGSMLTQVGGMVASTVIDFNSELQNANIGFTTMLGSGAKAKGFLDELQAFAKSTPFEFGNLVHNAQNMMGMGIAAKDVIPDLRALGDSVASIGGSAAQVDQVTLAFDQMAAKGTLDMGNMNQLMEGGVPNALRIMASAYGVTTSKMIGMISAGDVQASKALPALIKGIEKGTKATAALGGMMDKQSTTFTGALSNIQDGLTQTTAKAFKPFFDTASHGMQRFATALSGKPAEKFQKDVTKAIKPLATEIGKWFKGVDFNKLFTQGGKAVTKFFKDVKPKDVVKGFQDFVKAGVDIGKQVLPLFPKLIKLIHDWLPVAVGVTKWAVDTGKAFKHGADQWKDAFDVLGAGIKSSAAKVDHGGSQISDAAKNTVKAWSHGADQLNDFFNGVGGFFSDLVGKFGHGWSQIAGFVAGGVKAFQHGADQIIGFFQGIPGAMLDIGGHIVSGLVGGIQGAWGAVTSTIHDLVSSIPLAVRKLLGIASPSKVFHLIGTQVGQGLHLGMTSTIPAIQKSAERLVAAATSGRVTGGKTTASKAYAKSHNTAISATIADIRKDAKDLAALSKVFHDAASQVGRGLHAGLLGSVDQIEATAQRMVDALQLSSRMFGKGRSSKMESAIKAGSKRLVALSKGRDTANDTLSTAKDDLKTVLADRASFAASVKSGVMGNADVAGMFMAQPIVEAAKAGTLNGQAYQPSWTTTSRTGLSAVKASLVKLLADTRKFGTNLTKLVKAGIDPATYDELVQAGVRGGGLETSAALLADPTLAKSIFYLERQIGTAGGSLGAKTAQHEYAGQLRTARAAVTSAQNTVNHINLTMVVEAKKIDEVQKLITMVSHVKQTARKGKK